MQNQLDILIEPNENPILWVHLIKPFSLLLYCSRQTTEWLWPARQPFLASGHPRLGTMKTEPSLSTPPHSPVAKLGRPYLCYWARQRWFAPCFERPRRLRATLQRTCGCYFIYALSFFILTLKLLCSRVRALYIVRRNVNRGLLLRARGNVIQKQFEGNCKVMWPREPEAIETLNIISGQYNTLCRAAWKNRKTLLGQSLEN